MLAAMTERLRFEHHADNPAALEADGLWSSRPPGLTFEQSNDLRSHAASLRPQKRPGPKRTRAPKPKGKAQPRISDEKIADTGTMSVPEWAAKHCPELDMSDKKQNKAAYARFDRAAYHRRQP